MNQPDGSLAALGKTTNPIGRVQPIEPDDALMDVEEGHETIPWRGQTVEQVLLVGWHLMSSHPPGEGV